MAADPSNIWPQYPARRSAAQASAFADRLTPEVTAVYDRMLKFSNRPAWLADPLSQPIDWYWFYQAVDRAIQGEALEQTLSDAQALTEQHLACVQTENEAIACARQVDPDYNSSAE